jgi:hypothetical protein
VIGSGGSPRTSKYRICSLTTVLRRKSSISVQIDAISGPFCACMFSPFCLGELSANCPWSTLQGGARAVHMDALGPEKGKSPGEDSGGEMTRPYKPKS